MEFLREEVKMYLQPDHGCPQTCSSRPGCVVHCQKRANRNISGSGTLVYWSIYLTKCLFFLGLIWGGFALWTKRLRPDLNAQRLADQKLDQARADLKEVNS
jgi:hypothetical protein